MIFTPGQKEVLTELLKIYGFRQLAELSSIPKTTLYYMNVGLDRKYYVCTIDKLTAMTDMTTSEFLALP